eukprot:CAMPEP_0202471850 /NCGR_PEP_ID=MMETSP1360-20130828/85884_1 /ASSEMBLY_ACC=CAM_ASM_000848 /TAXON_ID=515479 /ORGANISM="Licmophora paradoxa, Strain CCMP2313" /LENGTH=132 /DNA_ID=CAMNT_0049098093 /DNA_START=93 /DNA_END=492 /DNA_ORIENTATION=+
MFKIDSKSEKKIVQHPECKNQQLAISDAVLLLWLSRHSGNEVSANTKLRTRDEQKYTTIDSPTMPSKRSKNQELQMPASKIDERAHYRQCGALLLYAKTVTLRLLLARGQKGYNQDKQQQLIHHDAYFPPSG